MAAVFRFTFLLLFALSGAALAQGGPSRGGPSRNIHVAAQGPWSVDCTDEPQTGERWCQVGTLFEGREPAFRLEFNYVRDSHMFFAKGATRLSGVRLRVDGQPVIAIERCLGGMCLLKGDGAARLLAEMRGGRRLDLHFDGEGRFPQVLSVELAGFEPMLQRALQAPK